MRLTCNVFQRKEKRQAKKVENFGYRISGVMEREAGGIEGAATMPLKINNLLILIAPAFQELEYKGDAQGRGCIRRRRPTEKLQLEEPQLSSSLTTTQASKMFTWSPRTASSRSPTAASAGKRFGPVCQEPRDRWTPTSLRSATRVRCPVIPSTPARLPGSTTPSMAANGWRCWRSSR